MTDWPDAAIGVATAPTHVSEKTSRTSRATRFLLLLVFRPFDHSTLLHPTQRSEHAICQYGRPGPGRTQPWPSIRSLARSQGARQACATRRQKRADQIGTFVPLTRRGEI